MASTSTDPVPPIEGVASLILDEVTGERVSKTELKKRNKLREKEKAKREREAAAPPKPVMTKKKDEEKDLNPNVRFAFVRRGGIG
jgi:lysyl-tRNA synthetase class 2